MRVLITGGKGQLGQEVTEVFKNHHETYSYGRDDLDITDIDQVSEIVTKVKPDVIIHTAAYTAVDQAESEPDKAYLVNAYGTRNVAVVAEKANAKLVYISTDYVFDGTKGEPYHEFDTPSPLGVYGKSKYAGEEFVRTLTNKHFIARTSWVYGKYGNNFVKTMLKLGREKKELRVVNDQIGSPTYTLDLANFLLQLCETDKYGVYHVSNGGQCSWYEFTKAIFELAGEDVVVDPCSSEEFPRPAQRPGYSVFEHKGMLLNGFTLLRNWKESLSDCLNPKQSTLEEI